MPQAISGTRVLLVEDREDVRAIATAILTRLGCRLATAATAEAALEALEHADPPIDVVFTDIHLPGGMSGYELAHLMRQRWPAIRTVMTSGAVETQVIRGVARHEGYPVVAKPYRTQHLLDAIRQVLNRPAGV